MLHSVYTVVLKHLRTVRTTNTERAFSEDIYSIYLWDVGCGLWDRSQEKGGR